MHSSIATHCCRPSSLESEIGFVSLLGAVEVKHHGAHETIYRQLDTGGRAA